LIYVSEKVKLDLLKCYCVDIVHGENLIFL